MGDLGWRAKSAALPRKREPIEGLGDDFGVRVRSVVQAMRDEAGKGTQKESFKVRKGRIQLQQNKGVEARAKGDFEMQETDESKEKKRQEALERKVKLYDELQRRVNLDDEAANDLHEVDFIGKALGEDALSEELHPSDTSPSILHPEEFLRQQQSIRAQMQGGVMKEEYSTYAEDVAELQARHKRVDETEELNAERRAEFEALKRKRDDRVKQKDKESLKQKQDILKRLLVKKQRQK